MIQITFRGFRDPSPSTISVLVANTTSPPWNLPLMCGRVPLSLPHLQKSTSSQGLKSTNGQFLARDALLRRSSLRTFSHVSLAVSIPCKCSRKLGAGVSLPLSKMLDPNFGEHASAQGAVEKPLTRSISFCVLTQLMPALPWI